MTRPLALVTGASSGIGLELSRLLVADGVDVVAVAEDDELGPAVERLAEAGDGAVTPVRADLRTPEGVQKAHAAVTATGRPLELAALNAGIGLGRAFVEQDLQRALDVVDLNVRSTVHLAHLVLRDMVARGNGRVLLTSSVASTQPGSFQAVYNASKSFVQSFAEALQDELRDTEVTVTSLMPGPTETEFFERADLMDTRLGQSDSKDSPADVAKQGYDAWRKGERRVVAAGLTTKLMEAASTVTPDPVKARVHRAMAEPQD
jgi:short-subunit dehydrogenase